MRVLVFGGRGYGSTRTERGTLMAVLEYLHHGPQGPITCIIQGEAPGADDLGKRWAEWRSVPVEGFPADWHDIFHPDARPRKHQDGSAYDANAGPRRNQRMIDEGRIDVAVKFPGGTGTADMLARVNAAPHIDLVEVGEERPREARPQSPDPRGPDDRDRDDRLRGRDISDLGSDRHRDQAVAHGRDRQNYGAPRG